MNAEGKSKAASPNPKYLLYLLSVAGSTCFTSGNRKKRTTTVVDAAINRVDDKQVQRTKNGHPNGPTHSQPCTKADQGRGNGHPWNHVVSLFPGPRKDAGNPSKKRHKHVEQRRWFRQQLAPSLVDGTHEEVHRRRKNGDAHGHRQVAQRLQNQPHVVHPNTKPHSMMGPINGEISIAPMITAVELTLRPMEAIKMLKTKIQRLNPRNSVSRSMPSMVA